MKLKILLIDAINKERSLESALPPLGLGYLASSLRQAFGSDSVELKIIDENIDQTIKQFKPQVVGLTAVSQNYNLAIKYARVVKRYGLPVIIGGVHISALPQTLA
ncbi:cobalamin B12-binding domain-containing protein, partial [Candidatus Parcubacteria bacterium]|nr:cobalamin B12-binding domain-containing protein [Candidatus Parcubacteria bacterium]